MFSKGEIVTYNDKQCVIMETVQGFAKIAPIEFNNSKKMYIVRFDSFEHLIPSDKLQKFNVELNFKDMIKRQEKELNDINYRISNAEKNIKILRKNDKYCQAINNYFTELSNNLPDMKEYCDIAIGLSEHKYKYYNLYSDYDGEISSFLHNIDDMLDETHLKQLAIVKKDKNIFEIVLYKYSDNSGGYSRIKFFETEEDCINSITLEIINMFQDGEIDRIAYRFRCKNAQEKIFKNLPKDVKNAILSYSINKELDNLQENIEKDSNKVELLKKQLNEIIG